MTKYIIRVFSFLFVGALLFAGFVALSGRQAIEVSAQTTVKQIVGQMWSSGIGWIDTGSPTETKYGLRLDTVSRTITGSAWSNNIGWVSFNPGDLTGKCPAGATGVSYNTSGVLSGYARAIVGTDAQGWDGCINFGYGNAAYNVTTGRFTGAAWGDKNVGWLAFQEMRTIEPPTYSCTNVVGGPATVNPAGTTVCSGDNTGLTASTTWISVVNSGSCTVRKCEYYATPSTCSPPAPSGGTACPLDGNQTGSWTEVTDSGACTSAPCQYYTGGSSGGTCSPPAPSGGTACPLDGNQTGSWTEVTDFGACTSAPCQYYTSSSVTYTCTVSPASGGEYYVNKPALVTVTSSGGLVSGDLTNLGSRVYSVSKGGGIFNVVYTTVGTKTLPMYSGGPTQCLSAGASTIVVKNQPSTGEN